MTKDNQVKSDMEEVSSVSKKQWPLVVFILFVAICISVLLYLFKPSAEKKTVNTHHAQAEYMLAKSENLAVPVISQGSIKAKTRIKLVAEVNGRINEMAKLKDNGGFFKQGDLLLGIDDTDYRLATLRADAQLAAAKQKLIRVETEAGQAKYDLKQIGRDPSKSTSYALREPQLAGAKANLQAAEAELKMSRLQMLRTQVSAPFNGRVLSKEVDLGQYVSAGTWLADIYSTESVIVRLPLSLSQTRLLGITLRNSQQIKSTIKISLSTVIESKTYTWHARYSHTEGEVDSRNRLAYLVAEVSGPYDISQQEAKRPPLTPGMFVKAQITGIQKNIIKIPRAAIHLDKEVWLIDSQDQLQKRKIEVLSKDKNNVYIKSGLNQGDRIIINAIDFPVKGMLLKPLLFKKVSIDSAFQ